MSTEQQIASFRTAYDALREEISKVIVGHTEIVESTLIALFGGGALATRRMCGRRV